MCEESLLAVGGGLPDFPKVPLASAPAGKSGGNRSWLSAAVLPASHFLLS